MIKSNSSTYPSPSMFIVPTPSGLCSDLEITCFNPDCPASLLGQLYPHPQPTPTTAHITWYCNCLFHLWPPTMRLWQCALGRVCISCLWTGNLREGLGKSFLNERISSILDNGVDSLTSPRFRRVQSRVQSVRGKQGNPSQLRRDPNSDGDR
jgi:hypothetical protein